MTPSAANSKAMRTMNPIASGTVLIKDAAGTTLVTNTTNAHLSFRFNGTQYVAITPVT